jgi:hypothetical protein
METLMETERNWAGTYAYRAKALHRPSTLEALHEIVARAPKLRALGSRHSFSGIGDSDELVSVDGLPPVIASRYERLDPRGAFRNAWLEQHVLGGE